MLLLLILIIIRQVRKDRILRKLGKISPNLPNKANDTTNHEDDTTFLLSELEATLSSSVEANLVKPAALVTTNKMKKVVAVREAARIKLVQQHPLFIQDPINAVKNHIQQMIQKKEEYSKKMQLKR